MNPNHRLIPLADVRPGMVLSDVLRDQVGHVLLAQGAVLSEAAIVSLGRYGVHMLPVAVEESTPPPDPEAVRARLDVLFRMHDLEAHDPNMALRQLIEHYRLAPEQPS